MWLKVRCEWTSFFLFSLIRSNKSPDSKYGLYIKHTKNWKLEGLKLAFAKRCASKIWREGSVRFDLKKNSTPSPWKRRKKISSATFCATGVWGFTYWNIMFVYKLYSYIIRSWNGPIFWVIFPVGFTSWRI